ncbi:hypothetical protein AK812_SmicGene36030 [Symbiodinium microadriaticum]|uniref:Uncharacterized protein n=1 Tax=Symbiodinium microadriaticum TaxID=2951 RepID=A0A1Q9CJZ9_SYMMI|nr:hypothetical protein AK812_SmicGene36030 [Symbiodinium microadriaticum]
MPPKGGTASGKGKNKSAQEDSQQDIIQFGYPPPLVAALQAISTKATAGSYRDPNVLDKLQERLGGNLKAKASLQEEQVNKALAGMGSIWTSVQEDETFRLAAAYVLVGNAAIVHWGQSVTYVDDGMSIATGLTAPAPTATAMAVDAARIWELCIACFDTTGGSAERIAARSLFDPCLVARDLVDRHAVK